MRYTVTCLTPTLVGDGRKLAPIDYMVWRDQVNVLDQQRIFRLLAKGPRLEGYLAQLKKADKLDFASWGGFAQNYSERRIPFEHPSSTQFWQRTNALDLFIPTFATGPRGPYLPATSIKGALRTAVVHARANEQLLKQAAAKAGEGRSIRQATHALEDSVLGSSGNDEMRAVSAADSDPISADAFKIYLLRVSTMEARGGGKPELAWKTSPRGAVRKADDSTPIFAEMAPPGVTFTGEWQERALPRRRNGADRAGFFRQANRYSKDVIRLHRQYAEAAGLTLLVSSMDDLTAKLDGLGEGGDSCMLPLGWGAGFFSKTAFSDTKDPVLREVLKQLPFYSRAIQSGLPFPKTRRIVLLNNQPATVAGFVQLTIAA